jgi:alpha-1,2-mannosyltransferase
MVSAASDRTALRLHLVLLAGVLVVFALYLRSAGATDQIDFGVYRAGGRAILNGRDLYSLRVPPVGLPFTYPPLSAVVFAPLAWLRVRAGQVVWMAASLIGLFAFVRLTLLRYGTGLAATSTSVLLAVFIVVAASDPLRVNFSLGQINVLIGLLVLADLADVLARVPRGVMTGVAAALKLTPLFLVAYFVLVRRYRAAAVAAGTFLTVTVLASAVAPHASNQYWLHGYFADARRTGGIAYISNQSINGVIVRLSGSPDHARAFWLPIAIVTAAAILWSVRRIHDQRPWLAESIALASMLLLSPVSWVHHWILVLPFLVASFRLAHEDRRPRVLLVLTCALTAALWLGIVWRVPNTHDREYHHNLWQFVVGNSDVLLLLAAIAAVAVATRVFSRAVRSASMR